MFQIINFFIYKRFKIFLYEIKFKNLYNLGLIFFTIFFSYINIHPILYLFSKYLLININTNNFFFTNLINILFIYLKLSVYFSFLLIIPFLILNIFLFFLPCCHFNEYFYILKIFCVFFFFYYFGFFFSYFWLVLPFLKICLNFEQQSNYFGLCFEPKFDEYFLTLFQLLGLFILIFEIPIFYFFLIKKNYQKYFLYKKYFYIFIFVFFNLFFSFEIFSQIYIYLCFLIFFEICSFFVLFFIKFF